MLVIFELLLTPAKLKASDGRGGGKLSTPTL